MNAPQVALQLYTVRDETKRDFAGTLRRVAQIGYTGVEFAGYGNLTSQEMAALLAETGLCAVGTHLRLDALQAVSAEQPSQKQQPNGSPMSRETPRACDESGTVSVAHFELIGFPFSFASNSLYRRSSPISQMSSIALDWHSTTHKRPHCVHDAISRYSSSFFR